jgi:pyrroline-5-carboxylate reductase
MGKLLLVGCGKMGGAMLDGWLARGLKASDVVVAEPVEAIRPEHAGLRLVASSSEVSEAPEIVVLAVKPQAMDATLTDLKRFAEQGSVFLSIAAGKTLGYFASHLGAAAKVVRSMPNTPAAVRQGITVATAASGVSAAEKKRCHELLEAVGGVLWVDDEALMDPVTALSPGQRPCLCLSAGRGDGGGGRQARPDAGHGHAARAGDGGRQRRIAEAVE